MPDRNLVSDVHAVDWQAISSTYESGEVVRDVILGLASGREADVLAAWEKISETVLQHQGTVYPATAAAAPFLCRLVLDPATMWRAALAVHLPLLSAGSDQPYAPAGTARAVRDAIRPYVPALMDLWGTDDDGLDLALVALSVAFPVEAADVVPRLRGWFGRSVPPLRTTLGLSLAFHSSAGEEVRAIVDEQIRRSVCWISRGKGLVGHLPPEAGSPRTHEEPYVDSDVIEAISMARRLQSGAEEPDYLGEISGFLHELIDTGGFAMIKYPG